MCILLHKYIDIVEEVPIYYLLPMYTTSILLMIINNKFHQQKFEPRSTTKLLSTESVDVFFYVA